METQAEYTEPENDDTISQDDSAGIVDDASNDDTVIPEKYDIASYGADYDVDGLVRRLQRGDIFIPDFQRQYMWNSQEASRFVESLLLGLPVPGVFLASEPTTGKLLVIDGQQRLKTLQFFYEGFFNPKPEDREQKVFKLMKVQDRLEGATYKSLEERDRLRLDNAIIHATIVKQESPSDDDTSVYHIFERLNNGGRRLTDQEIRTALYHGSLLTLIGDLNNRSAWRDLFGSRHKRLKDEEFLLRFLALYFDSGTYEKPMKEFLNRFAGRHRNAQSSFLSECSDIILKTIDVASQALGPSAFRLGGPINAAVFDSVMVGLARHLKAVERPDFDRIREGYKSLIVKDSYREAVSRATSDEASVRARLDLATKAFASLT